MMSHSLNVLFMLIISCVLILNIAVLLSTLSYVMHMQRSGRQTRGQSNLTKSASRGAIPRLGVIPWG